MKIGLTLHIPKTQIDVYCKAIEDAGLDSAWTDGGIYATFAHMLNATKRIEIGSAITPCFDYRPISHAYNTMFLNELSGGRFINGLGSQTRGQIRTELGMEVVKPVQMAREMLEILRMLLNNTGEGRLRYKGEFFSINLLAARTRFKKRDDLPPSAIYYSGVNRLNLRLGGEIGDGLVGHPIFPVRYYNEMVWPNVSEGLRRAGRSRADFDMCALPIIWVAHNEAERKEGYRRAKRNLAGYYTTRAYGNYLDVLGWDKTRLAVEDAIKDAPYAGPFDMDALEQCISDEIADEVCLVGTPDELRQKARERYEGLVDHMVFYVLASDDPSREGAVSRSDQTYRVIETFKEYKR